MNTLTPEQKETMKQVLINQKFLNADGTFNFENNMELVKTSQVSFNTFMEIWKMINTIS